MLELKNLSYSYNENQILENLNLSIKDHSFHSLVGLSGAGKTLILKLISGLLDIQSGTIDNCPIKKSFVFQNASFFPWLSIIKNLEICTKASKDEILKSLRNFRLDNVANMYPHQLSGGTLQKVSILRSFLNKAELILMDEPFVHLDMVQKEEIYSFTLNLWTTYKPTIILVTHDLDEALYLSESLSYLSKKDKKIVVSYEINLNRNLNFNECKTTQSHLTYFNNIYTRLREDLN
jgi:sulfonate transport system ATP-binding protein